MRQADPSRDVDARSAIDAAAERDVIAAALLAEQFEHDGWQVSIAISGRSSDGLWSGYASMSHAGTVQCRIVLAGQSGPREQVISLLARKARAAIESRKAGGNDDRTQPGDLGRQGRSPSRGCAS